MAAGAKREVPGSVQEALLAFGIPVPARGSLCLDRPEYAAVAWVFRVAGGWILRGRVATPDVGAAFEAECALLDQVRPLVPYAFPEPIPSASGNRLVIAGGLAWTMYREIPGRVLWPWQRLHLAPDDDRRRLVEVLKDLHDRTRGRLGPGSAGRLARDAARCLCDVRPYLSEAAARRVDEALARVAARRVPAAPVFVHGDFHWGNILVDDGGHVSAVLDLDGCRVSDPLEDLGYTAMMLVRDPDGSHVLDDVHRIASWYGLPAEDLASLADHVLLWAVFDVRLFLSAEALADRDRWVAVQLGLVESASRNLAA